MLSGLCEGPLGERDAGDGGREEYDGELLVGMRQEVLFEDVKRPEGGLYGARSERCEDDEEHGEGDEYALAHRQEGGIGLQHDNGGE